MNTYTAVAGQSLYDVCLIIYGTLDFLVQLAMTNGITDLNNVNLSGIAFSYNNAQIANPVLHQQLNQSYGTAYVPGAGLSIGVTVYGGEDGGSIYGTE